MCECECGVRTVEAKSRAFARSCAQGHPGHGTEPWMDGTFLELVLETHRDPTVRKLCLLRTERNARETWESGDGRWKGIGTSR